MGPEFSAVGITIDVFVGVTPVDPLLIPPPPPPPPPTKNESLVVNNTVDEEVLVEDDRVDVLVVEFEAENDDVVEREVVELKFVGEKITVGDGPLVIEEFDEVPSQVTPKAPCNGLCGSLTTARY